MSGYSAGILGWSRYVPSPKPMKINRSEKEDTVRIKAFAAVAVALLSSGVDAETYRCVVNGKTMISDTPCVSRAKPVVDSRDKVTADELSDAYSTHRKNQVLLRELEERNAPPITYGGRRPAAIIGR